MYDKFLRVAGVTMKNESGEDIQTLLQKIAAGYKRADQLESWNGYSRKDMLEDGLSETEYEGQEILGMVEFVEEPENPYDPNAIKVYLSDVDGKKHHVGYVKKDYTKQAQSLIGDESVSRVTVEFTGGKSRAIGYDPIEDKDVLEDEEMTRGLAVHFHYNNQDSFTPEIDEPKIQPADDAYGKLNDKQKAAHDKWIARSKKMEETGKGMQQVGGKMAGCGCLMTIFITIPIILIIIFLFL
ncbi:hypothetical protein NCCP2716_01150 [Sporosarcina sp. NCCP-2716]|uniref:HIRAN domain-containing protein n=1 Tax=Sporosarcina sp. NCCP-2716 TaxID=2943679 RepID=UPI00204093D2|nr:HIRAN domain-containing protein [Sporosarcina sp. NCCP-2716]GKV67617.1 hypothetical protein NCCP2716_01150 [Sporosarcina sp. NCCP-2716]